MESRHGTCTSCHHSFKVPAATTAQKAKCPKCGGVVVIEGPSAAPAQERAPSGAASAAAKPRPGQARPASARAAGAASAGRARGETAAQKKSPLPLVLGGAGVLVLIGLWFAFSHGKEEPATAKAAESVALVDLSKLPDLKPLDGTSDEDWAAMNELVTRYITPPFGPNST